MLVLNKRVERERKKISRNMEAKQLIIVRKKLHRQGGSLVLVVPKLWADAKGLKANEEVEIQLNDELTMTPLKSGAKTCD